MAPVASPGRVVSADPVIHDSRTFTAPGWRYDLTTRPELREVLLVAIGEIGVCEVPPGSNAGPVLRYGGEPGAPWCAMFVSWAFQYMPGGSPFRPLASAYKLREWARAHGCLLDPSAPLLPGDVLLEVRADYHGHAALVVAVDGGAISTVEGNVHSAVRGMVRARSEFTAAVRPVAT